MCHRRQKKDLEDKLMLSNIRDIYNGRRRRRLITWHRYNKCRRCKFQLSQKHNNLSMLMQSNIKDIKIS